MSLIPGLHAKVPPGASLPQVYHLSLNLSWDNTWYIVGPAQLERDKVTHPSEQRRHELRGT